MEKREASVRHYEKGPFASIWTKREGGRGFLPAGRLKGPELRWVWEGSTTRMTFPSNNIRKHKANTKKEARLGLSNSTSVKCQPRVFGKTEREEGMLEPE